MSLPTLNVSIDCGSCGESVEHDGDSYRCFDCGLVWSADPFDGSPAEYADDEQSPCGHPSNDKPYVRVDPFRTVNGVVEVWRTWTTVDGPCHLPKDHGGGHDHPMSSTYTEHTEKP